MTHLAAGAAMLLLVMYASLVHRVPSMFGWLHPRGGIAALAISLAMAWIAIRLAADPHRPPRRRFELAVAGWLWMLVQAGALLWFHFAQA